MAALARSRTVSMNPARSFLSGNRLAMASGAAAPGQRPGEAQGDVVGAVRPAPEASATPLQGMLIGTSALTAAASNGVKSEGSSRLPRRRGPPGSTGASVGAYRWLRRGEARRAPRACRLHRRPQWARGEGSIGTGGLGREEPAPNYSRNLPYWKVSRMLPYGPTCQQGQDSGHLADRGS